MMELVKTQETRVGRNVKYSYRLTGSSSEVTNWLNDVGFDVQLSAHGNVSFNDGSRAQYLQWCQDDTWQLEVERSSASKKLRDALENTLAGATQ